MISKSSRLLVHTLIKPSEAKLSLKEIANELTEFGTVQYDYILSKGTALSVISAHKGKEFTCNVVARLIFDMCKAFNVIRPMTSEQIGDLSFELVTEYYFFKLEDFCAFFHLCRKGKFGRVLDRIDPGLIYEWLAAYTMQRESHIEKSQIKYDYEQPASQPEEEKRLSNLSFGMSLVKDYANKSKIETDRKHPAKTKK